MKKRKWSISRLSKESGINAGTLSSLINGNKIMAVDQLDRITAAMELPLGHYYESYIEECLAGAPLNWRRMKPFLYRCASLDKLECMKLTVSLLMDNLIYSPLLFDTAEDFFRDGKQQAALILYENVAASEWKQHSERLALCQYRIFTLKLGKDQAQNLQLALQFEAYVERLEEIDQLDALKSLLNTFRALQDWSKVSENAEKLLCKAKIMYFRPRNFRFNENNNLNRLSRPLFSYIAYAYLMHGCACDGRKEYEQALEYVQKYANLNWVRETDEETLQSMSLFAHWAKLNALITKLFMGKLELLPEYVSYIETNQEELLIGLLNVFKLANLFDLDVVHIIDQYRSDILTTVKKLALQFYRQQFVMDLHVQLLLELAKYYLQRGVYTSGREYLLKGISESLAINNRNTHMVLCEIVQELTESMISQQSPST